MEESDIEEAIIEDCLPRYPENKPPKTVQVDATKNLVKGRNTFHYKKICFNCHQLTCSYFDFTSAVT